MTPATEKKLLAEGESASPLAPRLDLLLQHAISIEEFEADMVRVCRADPEEIWNLLALLDQYHRLEVLPTELFRSLKASADRFGLVRREPYIPNLPRTRAPSPSPRENAPLRPAAAPGPARQAGEPRISEFEQPTPRVPPIDEPPTEPQPIREPRPDPEPTPPAPPAPPPVVAAPPATRTLQVGGTVLGRYRLEAELEGDDRGRIFQALDQQHAGQPPTVCQVAVHCMEPDTANFETMLADRRAEFQLAQPLSHPNVLGVRELDQDGVYIYLTMNLMRGETLAALLERRNGKALARSAAFAIIRDIGAALSYAHDHGVVHGNLQPGAVLISPAGELRIRGFGAQRALSPYASCEQLEGRPPDRRDDLYALACISYELLHGSHPFDRQNASTARGRGMTPARPIQLSGTQWRALRQGLAWRREGRKLSVARWIGRMHVGSASKRLPMLVDLMAMPAPRRSFWRPVLLLGCLAAAAAFALSVYRSPEPIDFGAQWDRLRAAVTARVHPPDLVSAAPAPSASQTPEIPAAPQATPEVQDTSPPAPQAQAPETPAATAMDTPPAAAASTEAPASAPPASTVAPLASPAPPPSPVASAPPPVASADSLPPAPRSAPAPSTPRASSANAASKLSAAAPAESAPARTPEAAPATAARIELAEDSYVVQPGDSAAHILVRRTGATRAEARFVWWTENATASADQDFVSWGRRTQRIAPGQSNVTLLIPIIKDPARSTPRKFYVHIAEDPGSAKLGAITRATVQLHGPG